MGERTADSAVLGYEPLVLLESTDRLEVDLYTLYGDKCVSVSHSMLVMVKSTWPSTFEHEGYVYTIFCTKGRLEAMRISMDKPIPDPEGELERVWKARGKAAMVITIPWDEWRMIERSFGKAISSHEVRRIILAIFSGEYKVVKT